jgi:hypothetical protein
MELCDDKPHPGSFLSSPEDHRNNAAVWNTELAANIATVLIRFQPRPHISTVGEHSYEFPSSSSTHS